jgi:hypothetical protein
MRALSLPVAGLALLLGVAFAAPAHAASKKRPPQVSTTSITLGTDPSGATVTLIGTTETKLGVTPIKSVRVPRGEVTLKITLDGYQDDTEKLTIGSSSQTYNFKLVRNIVPGELTFTADTEYAGASVSVDGTSQGIVPSTFKTPPGRHQVVISKEGFQDYQRWVDVTEGMKATYDVVLTKKEAPKGTLILTSAPLGAEVKVDGQVKGKTPAVLEGMTVGDHTIEWALADYKPAQKVVAVEPGKSVTADAQLEALPRSQPGSLLITSSPSGGEVKVDGESKGKTPTVVEGLLAGDHAVSVEVAGFKAFQKTVRVEEGKRATLDVPMESTGKPVGDLKVVADMDGVQIYLDGELIGPAPIRKSEVEPGSHLVEGRLPNLNSIKKEIEIKVG